VPHGDRSNSRSGTPPAIEPPEEQPRLSIAATTDVGKPPNRAPRATLRKRATAGRPGQEEPHGTTAPNEPQTDGS
jgi:hypothetical protein